MSGSDHPVRDRCMEMFARLSEYLDDELEPGVCQEIEDHMGGCPPCIRFLESLRRTVTLVQTQPSPVVTEEIRAHVREAVERFRLERGE